LTIPLQCPNQMQRKSSPNPSPLPAYPKVGFIYPAMTLATWAHQLTGYSLLASKVMARPGVHSLGSRAHQLDMLKRGTTVSCTDLVGLLHYHIFF
jgi:hypothetical protein